ncbi:MAG: hypothetical protein KDC38_07065 [Planctomycetes bacterium]|nr:hypothetical protein [Planctomycetota bacterium]
MSRVARRSVGRAPLLLIAWDSVLLSVAVTFSAGRWTSAADLADTLLVASWAAVPRLFAPFLGSMRRPRPFPEALFHALLILVVAVALFVAGIDLLWGGRGAFVGEPETSFTIAAVVLAAWTSAFFLFHSAWYRVHDVVILGAFAIGLVHAQPQPVAAGALFLLAFSLSASIRNLLHNVYSGVRESAVPWRAAHRSGFRAAVGMVAGFVGLYFLFSFWAVYEDSRPVPPPRRTSGPIRSIVGRDSGTAGAPIGGEPARPEEPRPDLGLEFGLSDERGEPLPFEEWSSDQREIVRRIALGQLGGPRMGDLGPVRASDEVAFRLHVPDASDRQRWQIQRRTLFRAGASLGPRDDIDHWPIEPSSELRQWVRGGRLEAGSDLAALGRQAVEIEFEVVTPGIDAPVAPYTPRVFGPISRSTVYRRHETGGLSIVTGFEAGDRYRVLFRPLEFDAGLIRARTVGAAGVHEDPRTLEVPSETLAGIDLRAFGEPIFEGTDSIASKLIALRRFYQESSFRYALRTDWRAESHRLATFLTEQRTGDCNYFAIATAVLLRVGGVSTRVAVGLAGAMPDPERFEAGVHEGYLLRHSGAHAWTEVFIPDYGWVPIDPATWIPIDAADEDETTADVAEGAPKSDEELASNDETREERSTESSTTPPTGPAEESAEARRRPRMTGATERGLAAGGLDGSRFESEPPERAPPSWIDESAQAPIEDGPLLPADRARELFAATRSDASDTAPPGLDGSFDGDPVVRGESPDRSVGAESVVAERGAVAADGPRSVASLVLRTVLLVAIGLLLVATLRRFLVPPREESEDRDSEDPSRIMILNPLGDAPPAPPGRAPEAPDELILYHYRALQYELSRTRRHRREHETPAQHARRIGSNQDDVYSRAFRDLISRVYAVLYGRRTMTVDDVHVAEASARKLRGLPVDDVTESIDS